MAEGDYNGCAWPVDAACFADEWETYDEAVQDRALALATSTLERLTGYRVGNCPVTVRPCKRACALGLSPYRTSIANGTVFNPHIAASGNWINSCGCTTDCSCSWVCEVALPAPVGRVDEVKIDGLPLEPMTYRIDNGNMLVWTGPGPCPWPACQEMGLADTEVGTFSVTYLNAYPVDYLGAYAAGLLAMEYGRACSGSSCRLPLGVTSVARQGIQMEIASGAFPGGLTGIREVDAYIAVWNPQGLTQGSTVWSPDIARTRRVGS